MNKYPYIFIIPSLLILGLISLLPAKTIEEKKTASVIASIETKRIAVPNIRARAALTIDLINGKILFEKNSKESLPLASLTKIISVLVIEDYLQPDDVVQITQRAIMIDGASSLRAGEHLTVNNLLAMAMVESSNDAISALVELTASKQNISLKYFETWFVNLMQQKAESFGAHTMVFHNPTGLDISPNIAGGYGSAEDVLRIVQKSYDSNIWRFSSEQKIISKEGKIHTLNPTNILEGEIPQLIGSKTGFTDIAGGNLLIIFEYPINHPVATVVLGSTSSGRFEDIKLLFNYIKNVLQ